MTDHLSDLIDGFAQRRVLVIGDAILDSYLEGACARLCPEAPVPVVDIARHRHAPGGAANTAANVRALGATVHLLTVVGADAEGTALRRALAEVGVGDGHVLTQPERRTLGKQRIVAQGQVLVRCDRGDTGPLAQQVEQELLHRLALIWPSCDAVLVSDYGYGTLTPRARARIAELQRHRPRALACDSKRLSDYRTAAPTVVKPNFAEAARLLGLPELGADGDRVAIVAQHGPRVLDLTGARVAAVTLDTDGALVFERGRPPYRTYARPRPGSRASGAGDTFLAALALALAGGADAPGAAELAAAAAGVVVEQDGTARCTARALRDRLAGGDKVADREGLIVRLAEERHRGRRIVLTNGCFDILHRGHVTYLSRAKALGDVLVVGVNTDAGIRRLKGPTRPVNPLEDRLQVLAALSCVDHLIAFDEDTPHELVRAVRPDVFVKGGDYTRDRLPEATLVEQFGGVVRILSLVRDRSTTDLIAKIRAAERPQEQPT